MTTRRTQRRNRDIGWHWVSSNAITKWKWVWQSGYLIWKMKKKEAENRDSLFSSVPRLPSSYVGWWLLVFIFFAFFLSGDSFRNFCQSLREHVCSTLFNCHCSHEIRTHTNTCHAHRPRATCTVYTQLSHTNLPSFLPQISTFDCLLLC